MATERLHELPYEREQRLEREDLERFHKAAEAFTKRHTVSREAALAILVEEGIYTPDGKLTKNYGGE